MSELLGLYIHFPFCEKKCPYCSFYSLENMQYLKSDYIKAVCREIFNFGKKINKKVDTIYLGGGTPSIFTCYEISEIIKSIKKNFKIDNDLELTMEVNPADYENIDFEFLKFSGVNRISIGAQTLDDKGLKVLGRRHNVKDIFKTYNQIKVAKIDNISFDLILGFPGQTKNDIDNFINFYEENKIPHLSAYMLKIEEGTPYYESNLKFASDDLCSDFYIYLSRKMKKLGYCHYEISNFCLEGKHSRHNLKYWNIDDYLGIGPSAHSLIDKKRFYYKNNLKNFINCADILDEGIGATSQEYVMLKLRLSEGISNDEYKNKFGIDLPEKYFKKMKKFEELGLAKIDKNKISLTEKGFLLSNKIIGELIL